MTYGNWELTQWHMVCGSLRFRWSALRFRQTQEELFAVSESDVSADGASGTILRLVALD